MSARRATLGRGRESAGKIQGHAGGKIGNAHLKWAFGELATTFLRAVPPVAAETGAEEIIPLEEMERRAIIRALEVTGGDVPVAAARLGVSRATIYRRAERYRVRRAT